MRYAAGSPGPVWGNTPDVSGPFSIPASITPTAAPVPSWNQNAGPGGGWQAQQAANAAALQQAADAGVQTSGSGGGWNPEPGLNQSPETQQLLAQQAQYAALLQQYQGAGAATTTTATATTAATTPTGFMAWLDANPWLAAGLGVGILVLIYLFTRGRR